VKYSLHQSKNVLLRGKTSAMPTPVPRPRMTLVLESIDERLLLGLGAEPPWW
jgi:hypothetical protein